MPPLTPAGVFAAWQFAPLVSVVLAVLAAAYLTGVRLAARQHPARRWPGGRTAAFLLGLLAIAVATEGSPGAYDDVLFSAHMVQHLLLIMVAPPLLILGRPVTLLLHVTRNPVHSRVKRALRSRIVSGLTWPPVAVTLYAAVVACTHLTPLMSLVLEYPAAHEAEHGLYLVTGYLFFLPVVGSEPVRWRLPMFGRFLLLLAAMPVDTVVGLVLMLASGKLHQGGLVMLAGSDLVMTALAVAVAVGMVRPGSRADVPGDLQAYNAYLARLSLPVTGRTRPGRVHGRARDDDAPALPIRPAGCDGGAPIVASGAIGHSSPPVPGRKRE